ncbi:uncharacterized protein LTR77_003047 [Saxophila tyrrhenica]|uniref:Uncharacterized protein n=1 Tax=Saxophila tyrrhenica TaxID=1690608 RepID=A0AAV9PJX3_9PEZI|nr:hypothetical protein LTR77_003047 [Saxophila tyrrhenica]
MTANRASVLNFFTTAITSKTRSPLTLSFRYREAQSHFCVSEVVRNHRTNTPLCQRASMSDSGDHRQLVSRPATQASTSRTQQKPPPPVSPSASSKKHQMLPPPPPPGSTVQQKHQQKSSQELQHNFPTGPTGYHQPGFQAGSYSLPLAQQSGNDFSWLSSHTETHQGPCGSFFSGASFHNVAGSQAPQETAPSSGPLNSVSQLNQESNRPGSRAPTFASLHASLDSMELDTEDLSNLSVEKLPVLRGIAASVLPLVQRIPLPPIDPETMELLTYSHNIGQLDSLSLTCHKLLHLLEINSHFPMADRIAIENQCQAARGLIDLRQKAYAEWLKYQNRTDKKIAQFMGPDASMGKVSEQ